MKELLEQPHHPRRSELEAKFAEERRKIGEAFGGGQTIAVVDAYDDPQIYQALDAFDS